MNQLNLNNSMVSSANGHYLIVFILLEKFLTFTRPPKSHQTICTRFILTSVQSPFPSTQNSPKINPKTYLKLMRFLEKLLVSDSSIIMGRKLLPGIYSLGKDDVQKERNEPGSATRNPCGQIPHLWGQALFIICRLLIEGCLTPRRVSKLMLIR